MPQYDAHAHRNIEGVLGTILRDFKRKIRGIDNLLGNSGNLIAEDDSILTTFFGNECVEHDRIHGLLGTYYCITVFLETTYGVHCVINMLPSHAVLRSQGRFMDFGRWRHSTDSA